VGKWLSTVKKSAKVLFSAYFFFHRVIKKKVFEILHNEKSPLRAQEAFLFLS
jgi:hypothetical protein